MLSKDYKTEIIRVILEIRELKKDRSELLKLEDKFGINREQTLCIWDEYKRRMLEKQKFQQEQETLTKDDILMLSAITGYCFVENFMEVFRYVEKRMNREVSFTEYPGRVFQAKLKGVLYKDLENLKQKIRRIIENDR